MRSRPFRTPGLAALAPWLVAATAGPGFAHDDDHPPVKVADSTAHRATAIPDRIILTWTGDPARTQAVSWRTDASVTRAFAQIAPAGAAPKFVDASKSVDADSRPLTTDLGVAHFHSASFDGLTPSSLYAYRVGDGVNWSEWFHFRTASDKAEPFSFIYFGDAQNDIKSLWSRVIRGAYSDAPKAKFIIHAGDLIDHGTSDAQWGEWHAAGGWVNGMVPSVPTPGNHEYDRPRPTQAQLDARAKAAQEAQLAGKAVEPATPARAELSPHWRAQFALPENGPEGLKESAYFLDYQGTRIVSLNSNEKRQEQVAWLDEVLGKNPNRWTVVTFHHPVYSAAQGRDNKEIRDLWQPVFDKYKVDLVLQGHDHTYARSGLRMSENVAEGASVFDGKSGTVYVVSVSGPKMYDLQKAEWMRRAAEDTQLYQVVKVAGDRLTFEAKTATGELYDAFELLKRDGRPNDLVEKAPKTPENRRTAPLGSQKPGTRAASNPPKSDLDAFQGKWLARTGREAGREVVMEVKAGAVKITWPRDDGSSIVINGELKFSEKAGQKRVDFINFKAEDGDVIRDSRGIYAFEGAMLKVCVARPGSERPEEFKNGEDRYPALLLFEKK